MAFRIAVTHEPLSRAAQQAHGGDADLIIAWRGEQANVNVDLSAIHDLTDEPLPETAQDLLGIAIGLFIADIAVRRGEREDWTRDISLAVPVHDVSYWKNLGPTLHRLVFDLTRDNLRLEFYEAPGAIAPAAGRSDRNTRCDCVSMLSGGLDSLAGAVMLQAADRRPAYCLHRSGNPSVRAAQENMLQTMQRCWPNQSTTCACTIEPASRGENSLPFPPAEEREPSRRVRSLLFMALALVIGEVAGVEEIFMCENGVLTAALPLSPSRAGSMSTHSTHPVVLQRMNQLAAEIGFRAQLSNPFVFQTKGELLRDVLAQRLSPAEIQSSVSCWMTGRAQRQCGGCVPCLLRRLAMAWAGLPEEAYMIDLLESPSDYVGTNAYGNLIDMLRQIRQLSWQTDAELLSSQPGLLSLYEADVPLGEVIAMLRRHAEQSLNALEKNYPRAAVLIE